METFKLFVLTVSYTALICVKNNPDAALGDDCSTDVSVCDTSNNEMCNGTNCVCAETHYDNGGVCKLLDTLKPTNLMSSTKSHNSVTLSWTSPPAPGYTNSYVVLYYILGHPPAQSHYMYVNGQDTSTTVPQLSAGTIYNFIIRRTINREGRTQTIPNSDSYPAITNGTFAHSCSDVDSPVQCRTDLSCVSTSTYNRCLCPNQTYYSNLQCKPVDTLKPTGLTSSSQFHNSVTLSWTSPPAPGYTNSYVVLYNKTGQSSQTHNVNGQETSTTVPNLSAGTTYNFIIKRTINREDRTQTIPYSDSYKAITIPSLKNTEHSILHLVSGSETDTSVVLDVCPACFLDNKNGVIIKSGLLVCRLGNCPLRPNVIENADEYDSFPNWDKAKGVAFASLYRATDNDWMKGKLYSKVEKFLLGGESCALADQNRFCNGPLPVDHTYRVWLFACTTTGCTEGDHLEFTLNEKGLSLPLTAGIIAGVIVIIIIGIVLVVVYIKFIKPRRIQKAHAKYVTDTETFYKDNTYENITGGHRISVILNEADYYNTKDCPPRSDNTYDQLAVYKNEGNHGYGQINVTTT